jgi:glycosyltransferase involved in cell wall biosynthesis
MLHVVGLAARGGCETDCANFIRYAKEWDHDVVVLDGPGPMTDVWRSLGARVSHHHLLTLGRIRFFIYLKRLFKTLPSDGVILWAGIRIPIVLGAIDPRKPVVLHAGNPYSIQPLRRFASYLMSLALRRPRSVAMIACSEHVAVSFRRSFYGRSIPIKVVFNAVICAEINPHQVRQLCSTDTVRFGMVARLDPIKDHATVVRAMATLKQTWPNACLLFAGDGVLRGHLEQLAEELCVHDSVRFYGTVGDIPSFLRNLDVFCYATTEQEGMGIALAEALAAGLPCVVTDLPAIREVVGEPAAAALAARGSATEMASAMEKVARDFGYRRSLSVAAWTRARAAFSPEVFVSEYLDALGLGSA